MTKQLTSGQGGGIERRSDWPSTARRTGLNPGMHTETRAQLMSPEQLASLRPAQVDENVRAVWIKGRGPLDMGSLSLGLKSRWDIRIIEAFRRTILP